jgi:uncharacterized protein
MLKTKCIILQLTMPNLLQYETSPYLLQHANNPVDWYPWGDVAIAKAKQENKPILVSIGYAACHWCHVMEHESFENQVTADIMNAHFINIKIDREERPDIDHIYMDAVQAMSGQGGWPLNVFLTPHLKPFYGGTYFPPLQAYNRTSWTSVLQSIHKAWKERKDEIINQAEELTAHLLKSNSFGAASVMEPIATEENLMLINNNILKNADIEDGGFGAAPKFPQFHSITYLLRHYHFFKNEKSLQQAELSLQKMMCGGIYDHLGGGIARYSTDNVWLVPHFEKMLYDNALFLQTLSEAFLITKNELYSKCIAETIHFIKRDMLHNNHLFYAAIDADSEGVEGKYYCFTVSETKEILNEHEGTIFNAFYNVSENGNWTEPHHNITTNILHKTITINDFASQKNKNVIEIENILQKAKEKLLAARYKRVPPLTDDKCILGWNALMNKALVMCYVATGQNDYLQMAINNMEAILKNYISKNKENEFIDIFHTYKDNKATIHAFLDDIAYLIDALFHLYNATINEQYTTYINSLINYVDIHFKDEETPYFYFTSKSQLDIIVRKKEIYDGATPSGNSIYATVLFDAAVLFNQPNWQQHVLKMVQNLSKVIINNPNSFAIWASVVQKMFFGLNEISICTTNELELVQELNSFYIPYKLCKEGSIEQQKKFMLCKNYTCSLPVFSINALMEQINNY